MAVAGALFDCKGGDAYAQFGRPSALRQVLGDKDFELAAPFIRKRRDSMLFMNIFTWEPEKRDEVLKRRLEEKVPEGIKVIGEWGTVSGRSFRLTETDDPTAVGQSAMYWNDVGKIELFLVMEVTEEALKSFAAQ